MRLVLLSAERGAGKTTACQRFLDLAREVGLAIGGIVAPARYDAEGAKVGIDVVDIATGARRNLAVVERDPARATVGQYRFDPVAESWALAVLMASLDRPLDVVIVDEIGPLELSQGRGYTPVLERLPSARCRSAVILVRASLAKALADRLHAFDPITISLTITNRDQVPAMLLREIGGTQINVDER